MDYEDYKGFCSAYCRLARYPRLVAGLLSVTQMQVLDANLYGAALPGSDCTPKTLLTVANLSVCLSTPRQADAPILRNLTFDIAPGEVLGLVGESGSGKTTTALALMRMLPRMAKVSQGKIEFGGVNLLSISSRRLRNIRGGDLSIIFQDANVLNPVMRAGDQVMEVLRAHRPASKRQMRDEICELFVKLGLSDCDRVYNAYPHQLSGGQCRRVAIAQALICRPRLVVADEPTAWCDDTTTGDILDAIKQLKNDYGTSVLLISHDFAVIKEIADRLLVMYAGQIVESAPVAALLDRPVHPYTRALLACARSFETTELAERDVRTFPCIPGSAPQLSEVACGCAFASRCADRTTVCELNNPELINISDDRSVRCLIHGR